MAKTHTHDPVVLASVYRMTGCNFQMSARNLLSFIAKEDGSPTNATALPFYYLASHAAELFLKAALLKRGFPEAQLRQHGYRHSSIRYLVNFGSAAFYCLRTRRI
jgi:hypothetical protein